MSQSTRLTGRSGNTYVFGIYPVNAAWSDVAGIYALLTQQGVPVYIGQTNSFKTRLPSHEVWTSARREGVAVAAVAALTCLKEADRLAWEEDLIKAYNPRLNTQQLSPLVQALLSRRG
jgi:excinuclease UvrABC nuclease subunit